MSPLSIQIEYAGRRETMVIAWAEELGCFVGQWSDDATRRTGDTVGAVFDKLSELKPLIPAGS